jgi:hypothetical protein
MSPARVQVHERVRLFHVHIKSRRGQLFFSLQRNVQKNCLISGHQSYQKVRAFPQLKKRPQIIVQHPITLPPPQYLETAPNIQHSHSSIHRYGVPWGG